MVFNVTEKNDYFYYMYWAENNTASPLNNQKQLLKSKIQVMLSMTNFVTIQLIPEHFQ